LKTDESGVVKPGAKAVDAQAASAVPVLDGKGEVRAVVGSEWASEGEIAPEWEQALTLKAAGMPR
jgi:hypothetical protein